MQNKNKNIAIIAPTFNPGKQWLRWIKAVKNQTLIPQSILIVDSGSIDGTKELSIQNGFMVHSIKQVEFGHGRTRQLAINLLDNIDIVIFLTQDAILDKPSSLQKLLSSFEDKKVAAAYGRQLPRKNANPIEAHGRFFNYPNQSNIRDLSDKEYFGFKLIFISNSFAAYRVSALKSVGGFPDNVILGEDTYTCAKLIQQGWKVAYQASATVIHSHGYTILDEAKRYFDTGVLHSKEHWLLDEFGNTNSEGLNYIKSEVKYLSKQNPLLIASAIIRTIFKLLFYKLGRVERYLPIWAKKLLSMNKLYWNQS